MENFEDDDNTNREDHRDQDDAQDTVSIGGQMFPIEDPGHPSVTVPMDLILGLGVKALPVKVEVEIDREGAPLIPYSLTRKADAVEINFADSFYRKIWDGSIGMGAYLGAVKALVTKRADLKLEQYEDDGEWIHISFSKEVQAETCADVIANADKTLAELIKPLDDLTDLIDQKMQALKA